MMDLKGRWSQGCGICHKEWILRRIDSAADTLSGHSLVRKARRRGFSRGCGSGRRRWAGPGSASHMQPPRCLRGRPSRSTTGGGSSAIPRPQDIRFFRFIKRLTFVWSMTRSRPSPGGRRGCPPGCCGREGRGRRVGPSCPTGGRDDPGSWRTFNKSMIRRWIIY